jgi:Flp pilus assembly protein TadB
MVEGSTILQQYREDLMVTITSLWLPILLSAVFVFIASSVIHMLFSYHYKDYKKVPEEDKLRDSIRGLNIPPGEYSVPNAGSPKEMNTPEYKEKRDKGPVLLMTVVKSGDQGMGKELFLWFVYAIVVGIFAAYVAGRALGPGAEYLAVFRFAGFTAFACYTVAGWQESIWFQRSWGRTFKNTIDGLIYGLLTAGTFAWLWP